jgi:hypothetical protein
MSLIRGANFALILLLAPLRVKQNGWGAIGGNDAERSRNLIWRPMSQSDKPGPRHVPEPLDDRLLPIDKVVRDWIVSPPQGCRSLLREGYAGNPFQEMRGWLSMATWQALSAPDVEARIRTRNHGLAASNREAAKQAAGLRSLANGSWCQHLTSRPQRGLDRPDLEEEDRAIALSLETQKALRHTADLLDKGVELSGILQSQTPNTQAGNEKAYEAAFAATMAFGVRSLTAKDLLPKKFVYFLTEAHRTLCEISPSELRLCLEFPNAYWDQEQEKERAVSVSWADQARKVSERTAKRPIWDRLDRYEKGLRPPGVKVHITGLLESWESNHPGTSATCDG